MGFFFRGPRAAKGWDTKEKYYQFYLIMLQMVGIGKGKGGRANLKGQRVKKYIYYPLTFAHTLSICSRHL